MQIKLLSPLGELLQVITCFGGHVSVLRAHTPSDLKPYLRALSGAHSAERLVITVDGSEYLPEQHALIGFGEPPPHVGLTAREFLAHSGIAEGSIEGLLVSFGLDAVGDTQCSQLSPDQERRLRIIAATNQYNRALIINEPFEVISSQWRERFAEYLASATRSYNLLVVIPSLSYRPECWIDNDIITRLQVGQSVQRTIGFGSSGSENNALMDQIRAMIRDEAKTEQSNGPIHATTASASVVGAAAVAMTPHENAGSLTQGFGKTMRQRAQDSLFSSQGMQLGLLSLGVAVLGSGALLLTQTSSSHVEEGSNTKVTSQQPVEQRVAKNNEPIAPPSTTQQTEGGAPQAISEEPNVVAKVQAAPQPIEPPKPLFILDAYPGVVKTALVEAARGLSVEQSSGSTEAARPEAIRQPNRGNGNLFKLLEKAGSSSPDANSEAPSFQPPENYPPPYLGGHDQMPPSAMSQGDEDARREAIRQKFLEAIRNAAERRQAAENG